MPYQLTKCVVLCVVSLFAFRFGTSVAMHSETFKEQWAHYATIYSPPAFLFVTAGLIPCLVYWVNGFLLLLLEVKWPNAQLRERIESFRKQYKIQGKVLDVVLDGPKHKPGELRVFHVVKNLVIGPS